MMLNNITIPVEIEVPEGYEYEGYLPMKNGEWFFDLADGKVKMATIANLNINVVRLKKIEPITRTFKLDGYAKRHVPPGDYYSRSKHGTIVRKVGKSNTDGVYYVWKEVE